MISVSKQVEYAIEFLMRLSKLDSGKVLSVRQFSSESTISFLFLQRIARSLKQAGFVMSTQGVNGGYALNSSISDISIFDVVAAVEETPAIVPCMNDIMMCNKESTCTIKPGMSRMQEQMVSLMKETRIETLAV